MEEDTVINVTVTKETAIIDAGNAVMETMDGVTIITDGATEIIITIDQITTGVMVIMETETTGATLET